MKREWKPGDVAMVTDTSGRTGRGMCNAVGGWDFTPEGAGMSCYSAAREIKDARPLIVIDLAPEMDDVGGEVVAGWLREAAKADGRRGILAGFGHIARQIEAQVAPPRPDEPQDLAAVVECEHEVYDWARAVRVGATGRFAPWYYTDSSGNDDLRAWRDLKVVRILSPGVTP